MSGYSMIEMEGVRHVQASFVSYFWVLGDASKPSMALDYGRIKFHVLAEVGAAKVSVLVPTENTLLLEVC